MFTSKSLFSEIVCPYAQTCVLPRCIFKHPTGKLNAPGGTANGQDELYAEAEQETPRKRLKLGDSKEDTSTSSAEQRPAAPPKPSAPSSAKCNSSPKPLKQSYAATRPISPPPLKRKIHTITTPTSKALPSQNVSKTAPKIATKAPTKEGLNPRALKVSAPASHDMRFRLLRGLHDQLVRLNSEVAKDASVTEKALVLSDQELITRALDIEEDAAATPIIYSNIVKNKILLYKRMSAKTWIEERQKEVAAEKAKAKPSTLPTKNTEPPKPIETGLTLEQELLVMKRLQTHISSLAHAGFITSPPTAADIASANQGVEAAKGWEVCDRCQSRFQVFPERRESDGALASGGACTYHPGKPYFPPRGPNEAPKSKREKKYRCCNESVGDSAGCTRGDNHVFKISEAKRMAAVLDFVCTPETDSEEKKRPVCVDGEMGYTTYGLELIRLTATRWPDGKELFDVLVKPVGLILDLNSRYSGVWPRDFATALPYEHTPSPDESSPLKPKQAPPVSKLKMVESPAKARDLLFKHLSPSTPLIGHGLENDLNAMRVIHPTIVDTSLLFPHRAGLPFRNGLKALMSSLLGREIQVHGGLGESGATGEGESGGAKGGHDSKEDANAAGELVRHAIKEEWGRMKREGFVLDAEGKIVPPKGKDIFRSGEVEMDGTKILVSSSAGAESGKKRNFDALGNDW